MKKFLTLFVVLAMLIVSMSIPVSAATEVPPDLHYSSKKRRR